MPLAGGPSDKAGNRYELLWTAKCLIDVLLGRATSIRLEPPGADGIEFRLERADGSEVHQVKCGNSAEGRWRISGLKQVLIDFKMHLITDSGVSCVFLSAHATQDLGELSERGRNSQSFAEFEFFFLTSSSLRRSFSELTSLWGMERATAWQILRRMRFETISEQQLRAGLDQLLRIMFAGDEKATRAILCQLIIESTHKELIAEDVGAYLDSCGICRLAININPAPVSAEIFAPPFPVELVGRERVLRSCESATGKRRALIIAGPSGMGATST